MAASISVGKEASEADEQSLSRLGGVAAIANAILALVYAVGFVFLKNANVYAPALLIGGVLSAVALTAVYSRIRSETSGFALLGLLFGFAGTIGAIVHGGYDLANLLNPPTGAPDASLPFPTDPRGLMTFGISGIGVLALSWATLRETAIPRRLAWLGIALGVLLIVVYLGRLIVLDPNSPLILAPAGLAAIIVSPLWYAWIGRELLRGALSGAAA